MISLRPVGAHAALRHGMGMIQVASSMGSTAENAGKSFMGSEGELYSLLMTISRAHEFEADQFGALYAYRAGFNPAEAVTLHEKMLQAMGLLQSDRSAVDREAGASLPAARARFQRYVAASQAAQGASAEPAAEAPARPAPAAPTAEDGATLMQRVGKLFGL